MFKTQTSAQKILKEFPQLWHVRNHWSPSSGLTVKAVDGTDLETNGRGAEWWVICRVYENDLILKLEPWIANTNLAYMAIHTLYTEHALYEIQNIVRMDTEKGGIEVWKPKKRFNLHTLCLTRAGLN